MKYLVIFFLLVAVACSKRPYAIKLIEEKNLQDKCRVIKLIKETATPEQLQLCKEVK